MISISKICSHPTGDFEGTPSLWWTGQLMAKGRSFGGHMEVKRRLYLSFRRSLS